MKTYLETWFLYPIPGVAYEVPVTTIPPTRCPAPMATATPEKPADYYLPKEVREEMDYASAVKSWESFNRTIINMQSFGSECMKRWFPNGLPPRP